MLRLGGTDLDELAKRFHRRIAPSFEDVLSGVSDVLDPDFRGFAQGIIEVRTVFQGAHAAASDIEEFLNRSERILVPPDGKEVFVDYPAAEFVGQGVRE